MKALWIRKSFSFSPIRSRPSTPILISIEGNIGAGKTTLLNALRQCAAANPSFVFIDEPISLWETIKNERNESLLEVFYNDRRRWSYTFQNAAILTRFQSIQAAQKSSSRGKGEVFVTERCLQTDFNVFTKMLVAEKSIDKLEYELYLRWYYHLLNESAVKLSGIVFVATDPHTCHERIQFRGRKGEEKELLSLNYLESLDKFQRSWINKNEVPALFTTTEGASAVISFVEGIVSTASN